MNRKSISLEQLSDIYGFRIIVNSIDDCYRIIGIVHQKWNAIPEDSKIIYQHQR